MIEKRAIEFKLGSSGLLQTSEAIQSIIDSDDDLLLAAYGYAHAETLNAMHLGSWLKSKPLDRRLILLVGIHDTDINQVPQYGSLISSFNALFSHWNANSVPLERVLIYAVEHWHGKLLAGMQSLGSMPRENFAGCEPAEFEKGFSYDSTLPVAGVVREAIIGSSNATSRGMGISNSSWNNIRNFELDVHVLRGSTLELGDLGSKVHSILQKAIELVNTPGSTSHIATSQLRALLPSASGAKPVYAPSAHKLSGI